MQGPTALIRRVTATASRRIWLVTVAIALVAGIIAWLTAGMGPLGGPLRLRWWALAPMVYVSELTVVHLRYRRDAHSFSMSELPLVAGLFFASPLELIAAQLIGNTLALAINRRQPLIKLSFNVAQFTLQAALAVVVFRSVVSAGAPESWAGWTGAILAVVTALIIATALISAVIRLSGGRLNRMEMIEVLGLSSIATLMNTSLALIGVHLIWSTPTTAWLALVPPVVLFFAYRAYMSQREERSRLESLYQAMRSLHEAGHIEAALTGAATQATDMFEAEFAEIILLPEGEDSPAYLSAVGPEDRRLSMTPIDRTLGTTLLRRVGAGQAMLLPGSAEEPARPGGELPRIEDGMVAHIRGGEGAVGVFVVANRLGDISRFTQSDVKLLETFASQVSTTLVNGQLADSLAQLTELKDELRHQALHDSLTKLANRTLFADRLAHALERAADSHRTVAVLFLDLDDFKTVNDSLGHAAGDRLLVGVAQRIQAATRPGDTVARFGGDEFAVLLEDLHGPDDAEDAAERIVNTLAVPFRIRERDFTSHASIGVAIADAGSTPDQLLRDADTAMYAAKRRQKGTWQVFEIPMREEMTQRLELRADLAGAIENGELVVYYQPIVDLHRGTVMGLEALARWPGGSGLIEPATFIPFAEETGLIVPLGLWVLNEATSQVKQLAVDTGHELTVSVNISPNQLHDLEFPGQVAEVLERHDYRPELMILEITETVLMQTPVDVLEQITALGIRLAIDDFGTGYSSLSYLDRLPIEIIKVDRSFVAKVAGDEESSLARTIVQIGESLGLHTIVEGIETSEQLAAVTGLGVKVGQGFYLAQPMSYQDVGALLEKVPPGAPIRVGLGDGIVVPFRTPRTA
ncbi:MAG: EAL domain-containing protein [Acidimicrobiia bacterium]|nr:EAL domain-containing protein [Acidimicrobiia bacterium]NNF10688.1 EAL domain-containing protein [Acidimicrobiia bacterium]